jgi:RNA-directed DNA polymerase
MAGKCPQESQMKLFNKEEWGEDSLQAQSVDVFYSKSGEVSQEWISACSEERALTVNLLEELTELTNLSTALKRVVKNQGSSGVDGETVEEMKGWFGKNHKEFQRTLRSGSYQTQAVRGVDIPKPKGGVRQLGIPTVRDRLVQQAISQRLEKMYDRTFSESSFGYRKGRTAHQALRQAGKYVSEGYKWMVEIDLEKFFDKVNHDRLMWLLGTRIGDKKLLKLIGAFLRSGIMIGGIISQRVSGTPQGSPLSPILSNIILDELDKELERRGHKFIRYADDIIILLKSELAAKRVLEGITRFIENRLLLKVNKQKSRVSRPYEVNFLGHTFQYDGNIGLSKESERRFKEKIRQLTSRRRGISLEKLIAELNPKIRGWMNYFKNARMRKQLMNLESWIRHRIRCFRLKQCKRAIGIVRFLRKLGVPEWRCWILALSGKGWYRLSSCPQAHEGMNNKWFREIGLYGLIENYSSNFKETAVYESTYGGVRGRKIK